MDDEPLLQGVELGEWNGNGNVSTELRLEWRWLEDCHLDQVYLLTRRDLQPCRRSANVAQPVARTPAHPFSEESQRGTNVTSGKGEMRQ